MLIQKLRLKRGWSQEQLADLSGVSVRTIQRLERGQAGSIESLKALAAVFEVDFNELKGSEMDGQASQDIRADEALALAHVRKVKGFYLHLLNYAAVIGFLALLNLVTTPTYWWFFWPALGWGLGVVFQAIQIFGPHPFLGPEWEKREVERYLGRNL